jgi:hypothetical protein
MMIYTSYNPTCYGGEDRKMMVGGQPAQQLVRPYLKSKPGVVMHTCNPRYPGGGGRRITVPGRPRQKHETLSEKQTKRTRSVA